MNFSLLCIPEGQVKVGQASRGYLLEIFLNFFLSDALFTLVSLPGTALQMLDILDWSSDFLCLRTVFHRFVIMY